MVDGNKMKEIRILQNISQSELAKKIGVSRTTVTRYENGTSLPTSEIVEKILVALKVSKYIISSDHSTGYFGQGATGKSRSKEYLERRYEIEQGIVQQLEDQGIIGEHFFDLVKDYMALWDMKNDLIQDITLRGVSIPWTNGDKQKGSKRNDSISEMHKTSTQMLRILLQLNIKTTEEFAGEHDDDDF